LNHISTFDTHFEIAVEQETERFRILVIGNANAGKTTILEKVCHARPGREPAFFNAEGKKVGAVLVGYVGFGFITVFFLVVFNR
jgi:GTP-binding protein EngB required for normal cell division